MKLFRDHGILFVHSAFINLQVLRSFAIVVVVLKTFLRVNYCFRKHLGEFD